MVDQDFTWFVCAHGSQPVPLFCPFSQPTQLLLIGPSVNCSKSPAALQTDTDLHCLVVPPHDTIGHIFSVEEPKGNASCV